MYKALKHVLIDINTTCTKIEGKSLTWVEMCLVEITFIILGKAPVNIMVAVALL